jgi:DNA-binding NarL/FixJ family response regulator
MEWIKAGSSHLHNISHRNIEVHMCLLPKKEVIAILKTGSKKIDIEKVTLTEKEKEILYYILEGLSNKEIAKTIGRSPGTVNSHLDNIYRKLGCSSRLEASLIALKNGLFFGSRDTPVHK